MIVTKRYILYLIILILGVTAITGCDSSKSDFDVTGLKEFSSSEELENWLHTDDVSEKPDASSVGELYAKGMEIQRNALSDGYIISVDSDFNSMDGSLFVFCTTVIDEYVWYWDPQSDEVFKDIQLGKIE